LRKRYGGRHFWARGYFSTTSGNITDDVLHDDVANKNGFFYVLDRQTG
jgi:putative transposase